MPCEPVSWRLLDMKTEAISATNWCRLVFPILQTQKVKFSAHRLGTQLAQVQLSEKAPLRAAQRPALRLPPNLPSNVTAADPPVVMRIVLGQLSQVRVSPESGQNCMSTM